MKKPKTNKKKLYKKCIELAKTIAKERDGYVCQRCGKTRAETPIDASHIIPESASHRLAIDPYNIKALCRHCHFNKRHKDPNLAHERFNKKFPGRYNKLKKLHIEYQGLGSISLTWYEEQYEKLKLLKQKTSIEKNKKISI